MKIPTRSRYRKRIGAFSAVDVKHDESVVSFSTAAEFYNFDMSSGSLRDGYGLELNKLVPVSSSGYWVYRYYSEEAGRNVDQYVYQTVMGALRYYDSYTGRTKLISTTSYPPIDALNYRLNGKDVLLMLTMPWMVKAPSPPNAPAHFLPVHWLNCVSAAKQKQK